jgi:phosphoglycerate dehydrogenase-like enzyme
MESVKKVTAAVGLSRAPKIRKIVVGVIGGTIVLIGIALVFLPGPAVVVIPLGLVILASEFAWARHLLRHGGRAVKKARRGKWREAFSFARDK